MFPIFLAVPLVYLFGRQIFTTLRPLIGGEALASSGSRTICHPPNHNSNAGRRISNAGVAGAILMAEVLRQRQTG